MPDGSDGKPRAGKSTQEQIDEQRERAQELGDVSPEVLLLVLTEQMRDVLVHVRELTREVIAIRADLEDKDTEEVLSKVEQRLDQASGEEELLRLKSLFDLMEAEAVPDQNDTKH